MVYAVLALNTTYFTYKMGGGEDGCCMPRLTNHFAHAKCTVQTEAADKILARVP